jgi:hypothetical protein
LVAGNNGSGGDPGGWATAALFSSILSVAAMLTSASITHGFARAGIAVGSLAKTKTARTVPSWDSVRRIAEALGVTLKELAEAVEAEGEPS